jgi:hypothetical protein
MKFLILPLTFVLLLAGPLSAQTAKDKKDEATAAQKASEIVAKIDAACKLKPEQQKKLETAYLDYYTKHDALKKQKNILNKSVYDDKAEALKKARNTALKSTLTAEQYKQWTIAKDKAKKTAGKEKQDE